LSEETYDEADDEELTRQALEAEDQEGFNIDDFLREGGIDLDEVLPDSEESAVNNTKDQKEDEEQQLINTCLEGYLQKSSVRIESEEKDILGSLLTMVGSSVNFTMGLVANK
jgi:hypothetical protein